MKKMLPKIGVILVKFIMWGTYGLAMYNMFMGNVQGAIIDVVLFVALYFSQQWHNTNLWLYCIWSELHNRNDKD